LPGQLGHWLAPLTLVMMLLTFAVVIGRYLFNVSVIPVQEAVIYLHGLVFMVGIGYAQRESSHVRVDILYQRMTDTQRAIIDVAGTLVFLLPLSVFLLWTSIDYVSLSWSMNETSAEPGGLPGVYLVKTLIPLMAILLLIQGCRELVRNLDLIFGRKNSYQSRSATARTDDG
jgi:TRAP-type mannitol/chloroaromatic compound transport system permease small subunit